MKNMLTNEKYDFPMFILVDSINVGEITCQFIPYTINFVRITSIQSIVADTPQVLFPRKKNERHEKKKIKLEKRKQIK